MKILSRLNQELQNILYIILSYVASIKKAVHHEVPFVCQFALPEHAELSLTKQLEPINDPQWAETGALSQERYADWAFTMCGMASFAMVFEYYFGTKQKPAILAEDALKHGVYQVDTDGTLSAMRYREFKKWVDGYNLHARIITRLSTKGVQYALSQGSLVIVSVNPNIREYDTASEGQRGGHLVVVTGYDIEKGMIYINNPSGFVSLSTQVAHEVSVEVFEKYFASRGIIIKK